MIGRMVVASVPNAAPSAGTSPPAAATLDPILVSTIPIFIPALTIIPPTERNTGPKKPINPSTILTAPPTSRNAAIAVFTG